MSQADDTTPARTFLRHAGELGDLVDRHDWSATPIGGLDAWPAEMKAVLAFVLHSPTPMVTLWGDTGVMIYNDAYREFAGNRHPALLGSNVLEGWHEVADFNANVLQKVYREGGTLTYQDQPLTLVRDGTPRALWANLEYSPAYDEAGAILGVIAIVIETTERVLAERRAAEEHESARVNAQRVQLALGAGAIIGTWFWDLPTDRFTIDPSFARSFGIDPALGYSGLPLAQIIATVHPDDRDGLIAAIDEAIGRGGAYAHQYRVRRSDGHYYWIEANGRVDHAADGTPASFPGVLIDVDGRRAVEAERDRAIAMLRTLNDELEKRVSDRTSELVRAEDALRQSQKMEAVGQLTGGLAHDFNNLLAGISGALQLIGIRLSQGRREDVDRYMLAAQGAVKRAAALTHRLLAFSRRQTLDPKPTHINRLVAGMEELVRRTVGPSVELEVVGAGGLWPALVDPSQLENALLNLCLNARDAMPDGGRITIETANKWLDHHGARTHDLPEGQYVSLCVTDNGSGMTPESSTGSSSPSSRPSRSARARGSACR